MAGPDQPIAREELVRLLVAVGGDDRAAFSSLYRATSAKLFGICLRICGERQSAEEVLQEVYATVWRRAGGYDPGRGSPIAWLGAIARNRSIDRRRAFGLPVVSADAIVEVADPAPLASDVLLSAQEDRRLLACLEQLTGDQRGAIRTAFFDGLTYSELAAQRGVPVGTAKSWIRRGLLNLRGCLDDDA